MIGYAIAFAGVLSFNMTFAETSQVKFSQSDNELYAYDSVEITISVDKPNVKNPFIDVVVDGEFKGDDGKAIHVDGFCDSQDGSIFRIRFMPTQSGNYAYSVKYHQGDIEINHNGKFTAKDGKKLGLIRVDPEHPWHFICEGTGEHYFWNSTTTYWIVGWDDDNIYKSLDRLARLKINRIRATISGRVKDGQAWFENVYPTDKFTFLFNPWIPKNPNSLENPEFDLKRFNVAHWQKYDRMLKYAQDKGIIVSVIFYLDGARPGCYPFGKELAGGEDEQRYYRYAVTRFSAFSNVMWDVTNEYQLFRDEAWTNKMGTFLKECDPYKHLTSVHGHGDFIFRTAQWADFAMYQSWDEGGSYDFMIRHRENQKKTGRIIPQINEEYGYEDHYPKAWGGGKVAPARSGDNRRRLAWGMYMAGGYQTTGEKAETDDGWHDTAGGGWINGRGDDSMTMLSGYGYIMDFFTSISWWELEPNNDFIEKPDGVYASRSDKGDLGVVYFPSGKEIKIKPDVLKNGLKAKWYNPRNGQWSDAKCLQDNTYKAPDDNDWALLFN
ncbi:MAG: DUF4038 domain-containing protein [Candidatus Poribacteria bacterium]